MKKILAAVAMIMAAHTALAQVDFGTWHEANCDLILNRQMDVTFTAGLRTASGLANLDRWDLGAGYKFQANKWWDFGGGYLFMDTRHEESYTKKGKLLGSYYRIKNRLYANAQWQQKANDFTFKIRLRYVFTHKSEISVSKYKNVDGEWTHVSNEVKEKANDNYLRSRFVCEYKVNKQWEPFLSYELTNDMGDSFSIMKHRVSLGTHIVVKRKHTFGISYVHNFYSGDDEDKTHNALKLTYEFKTNFIQNIKQRVTWSRHR